MPSVNSETHSFCIWETFVKKTCPELKYTPEFLYTCTARLVKVQKTNLLVSSVLAKVMELDHITKDGNTDTNKQSPW